MQFRKVSDSGSKLFSVTIPLGEGADPWVCREVVDLVYQRQRELFSSRDVHGRWSAAFGIDGHPELIFSGYILKSMPLFSRRKKTVRVLRKIVTHMTRFVPLSSKYGHIIHMFYGKRSYHFEYQ